MNFHQKLDEPSEAERECAWRYVMTVEIRGHYSRDVYDGHPGMCFFLSADSKRFPLPHRMGMADAQDAALQIWRGALAESDEEREFDGQFHPGEIILRDENQQPLQRYCEVWNSSARVWQGQWLSASDFVLDAQAALNQARALTDEAALEARWDNHSTAEQLREAARDLVERVAIAAAQAAVAA